MVSEDGGPGAVSDISVGMTFRVGMERNNVHLAINDRLSKPIGMMEGMVISENPSDKKQNIDGRTWPLQRPSPSSFLAHSTGRRRI